MKNSKSQVKQWCRTIGIMLIATMIVAGVLGIFFQGFANRLPLNTAAPKPSKRAGVQSPEAKGDQGDTVVRRTPKTKDDNADVRSTSDSKSAANGAGALARLDNDPPQDPGTDKTQENDRSGMLAPPSGAGSQPSTASRAEAPAAAKPAEKPASGAVNAPSPVASNIATAATTRSPKRWRAVLEDIHKKAFHGRGPAAARSRVREKAEAELRAINDPAAVPAIWSVFAGSDDHHKTLVESLERINSPESTKGLVAVSVYSADEKARQLAIKALGNRDVTEFADLLIGLFNAQMAYRQAVIDVPGEGRRSVLLLEGERADVQFLYPPQLQPPPDDNSKVFTVDRPYLTPAQRQRAREFNKAKAQMAKEMTEQQLQSDIEQVKRLNSRIVAVNQRSAEILRELSGERFGPNREAWKRWLAGRQGKTYTPPPENMPKPTIAQIVPPLFTPQFVPVPAAPT